MEIQCSNISKRFKKEWLFKSFDRQFISGEHYALLGPNSSGKSTLLKIIARIMEPTEGEVMYNNPDLLPIDDSYQAISYSSPDMDLMHDYSVEELVDFHFGLKRAKVSMEDFYSATNLKPYKFKAYRELSSGLQQKVKLSLALFSDTPILFLDEPCTNFDADNVEWYQESIQEYCKNQLTIVASNQENEIISCKTRIYIKDYNS